MSFLGNTNIISIIYLSAIVCCFGILALPKKGDESDLPESIPRCPYEYKLWTAFILGEDLLLHSFI